MSRKLKFKVGDKVCVIRENRPKDAFIIQGEPYPVAGKIYTVDRLYEHMNFSYTLEEDSYYAFTEKELVLASDFHKKPELKKKWDKILI